MLGTQSSVRRTFSGLPTHSIVTINLDFVQIDSWDNERFYVYADDALVYTSHEIAEVRARRNAGCPGTPGTNSSFPSSFTLGALQLFAYA